MQISLNPFPLGLTTEVEAKPLPDKHKHNIVWEAFIMHTVPVDALGRAQNSASGAQGSVLCSVRGWSCQMEGGLGGGDDVQLNTIEWTNLKSLGTWIS